LKKRRKGKYQINLDRCLRRKEALSNYTKLKPDKGRGKEKEENKLR